MLRWKQFRLLAPVFFKRWALSLGMVCYFLLGISVHAEVRMPVIFGDHMVLQQDGPIPVWGWANPGEKVTVTLGGIRAEAVAGANGTWRVDLPAVRATERETLRMVVTGSNTIVFEDVLVGEVWLASGQSNMGFGIRNDARGAAALSTANESQIRLFLTPTRTALFPLDDLRPLPEGRPLGKWHVCTPEVLGGPWGWGGFSAVAYYFGREIHEQTGRPVGLIGSYWGGTPAQAWISLEALKRNSELSNYVAEQEAIAARYDLEMKTFPEREARYNSEIKVWNQKIGPEYTRAMEEWRRASAEALKTGREISPKPEPAEPKPVAPLSPDGGQTAPTTLYNAMISPIIPYGIRGVIWYQGENNAGRGREYQALFRTLIEDWRVRWKRGDFPFLYVQLANYQRPQQKPSEGAWAWLRESQLRTLALPHTAMAVTIDLGEEADIHPRNKLDVGHRLALAARRLVYGEESLVASGPVYESFTIEGSRIRLRFRQTGGGLVIGATPWTPEGKPAEPGKQLSGFAMAGDDRVWKWAKAEIDGETVIVSQPEIEHPMAVRYGWGNNPPCNLYNREGLPASPFRTDDWPPVAGE